MLKTEVHKYLDAFIIKPNTIEQHNVLSQPSIQCKSGKWFVPDNKYNIFLSKLNNVLTNNNKSELHFLEVPHNKYNMIKVDIDLRFKATEDELKNKIQPHRRYNNDLISLMSKILASNINKIINIPNNYKIYFQEKQIPRIIHQEKLIKDGIHIIIPDLVLSNQSLYYLREKIINDIELISYLKGIDNISDTNNVIDKRIIYPNAWYIYGCGKPEDKRDVYKVSYIYNINKTNSNTDTDTHTETNTNTDTNTDTETNKDKNISETSIIKKKKIIRKKTTNIIIKKKNSECIVINTYNIILTYDINTGCRNDISDTKCINDISSILGNCEDEVVTNTDYNTNDALATASDCINDENKSYIKKYINIFSNYNKIPNVKYLIDFTTNNAENIDLNNDNNMKYVGKEIEAIYRSYVQDQGNFRRASNLTQDEIKPYLDCIKAVRANDYDDWCRVGISLFNMDHRNYDLWKKWSMQSDKFDDSTCQKKWYVEFAKAGKYNMGFNKIKELAKQDNIDKFNQIININKKNFFLRWIHAHILEKDIHCKAISISTITQFIHNYI